MRYRLASAIISGIVVASLTACGSGSASGGEGGSGDPIKIGLTLDLTGRGSLVGQGVKYGVEMAEKEINDNGGVNGRKLKFVEVDSASTPDGGILAARKLVQSEGVKLIFGGSTSSSTVGALPYLQQSKVLYYAGIPSDPRVLNPFNKYVFEGAALPQSTVVPKEVEFVTGTLKAKKVAVITSSDAYAVAARDLLVPALQKAGATVSTQNYSAGDTDFTAQLQKIKPSNSDVVFSIGLPGDAAKVLTQARRAGITAPMVGDSAQADDQTISLAGNDAEGYYTFWFSSHQFLDATTDPMGSWSKALKQVFPTLPKGVPNQWTLQSYSDVYVLAQALKDAGGDPSPASVAAALEKVNDYVAGQGGSSFSYAHPIGLPRTFTSQDHQGAHTLVPVRVRDGHFQPVS